MWNIKLKYLVFKLNFRSQKRMRKLKGMFPFYSTIDHVLVSFVLPITALRCSRPLVSYKIKRNMENSGKALLLEFITKNEIHPHGCSLGSFLNTSGLLLLNIRQCNKPRGKIDVTMKFAYLFWSNIVII